MFITVLERALSLAQHNVATLFKTGWAYILVLVALNFAIGSSLMPDGGFKTISYMTEPVETVDEGALRALAGFANLLVGFSIAIAYVRRILIDARDFPLYVGARTFKVIVNQIVLNLIAMLSLIPLGIFASVLALITGGFGALAFLAAPFIALMVMQKFSLVLPAAAVDDPLTFKESWRATNGLGWAMAFAALVMSLLAAVLVGAWGLLLGITESLLSAGVAWQQIRSAVFPMGTMLLIVWVFSSLHATFYGMIRERFATRIGLRAEDLQQVEASREAAEAKHRTKAQKALAGARRMRRR